MTSYKHSGDYNLVSATLESINGRVIDLRAIFDSVTIVEDIFTNYNYGNISITDSIDLVQSLPLVGGEVIKFEYKTDSTKKVVRREFVVYKIVNNPLSTQRMIGLSLQFISKEALTDQNVLISKSFNGIKASDSVKVLFEELGSNKSIEVEQTLHLQNSIIPNWTPFQSINWLSTVSLPVKGNGSLFLLYEDKDGYKFKSTQSLYEQPATKTITGKLNREAKKGATGEFDFGSITEFNPVNTTPDILKSLQEGLYASKVIAYDNVTKESRTFEYDYKSQFSEFNHLNPKPLINDSFEFTGSGQRLGFVTTKTFRQESGYYSGILGSDAFSQRIEDVILTRSSQLSQTLAKSYEATIAGDSELTCGQVIKVEIPTLVDNKELGKLNRYYTENVLITKCVHSFTISQYNCKLSVSSDTYNDNFNEKYKP